MNSIEFEATLVQLSIDKKAFAKSIQRLNEVLDCIDRFEETSINEILSLREEGLTADEEKLLSRGLCRLRNVVLVDKLDLL